MRRLLCSAVVLLAAGSQVLAQDYVDLHSVSISNGFVRVEYSKNFITCAHLYRDSTHTITHSENMFCPTGENIVIIQPVEKFRLLTIGESVYLKHGNGSTRSASVIVTTPPVADAGDDQIAECDSDGTVVFLDARQSFDPDGDAISYQWSVPAGVVLDDPTSATPVGIFPHGSTTVTLTVTDENGASATDDVVIAVVDETPPEVVCTTDVVTLSPAKSQMEPVFVSVTATDLCVAPEDLVLVGVFASSDEPDDASGKGDGTTTGDVDGADGFTAPVDVTDAFAWNPETASFEGTILLRAERDKSGDGRTYTITAAVIDTSDNLAEASCVVLVPTSKGGGGNGGGGNGGGNGGGKGGGKPR